MKHIHFMEGDHIDIGFDKIHIKEVSGHIQMHSAVAKSWRVNNFTILDTGVFWCFSIFQFRRTQLSECLKSVKEPGRRTRF